MALVKIRKTVYKTYKGETKKYSVWELHKKYRDPTNKKKVISKYICYLGKEPNGPEAKERMNRAKEEAQGHYSAERLAKKMSREIKKEGLLPTTP